MGLVNFWLLIKLIYVRVKEQKLIIENLPLKKWLKDMAKKKTDGLVERAPPSAQLEGLVNKDDDKFTGKIPEEHFFHQYDDSKFMEIMEEQMTLIKALKKQNQPKYLANRILIIFDDLVSTKDQGR